jgi:hypothetical protein
MLLSTQYFFEFDPVPLWVLRIAQTSTVPLRDSRWRKKPNPLLQEIFITVLEIVGSEAKMN